MFNVIMMLIIMYKYMLIILMIMELIILNFCVLIYMYFSLIFMEFYMIYFLVFFVCESVLGLSLMVLIIRFSGKEYYNLISMKKF